MTPWLDDGDVRLYHGDALDTLRQLPDESVDCVVTSPPYWGLRDYGDEGQLGLEPTPDQYVQNMVEVFREVRRVLADHGTCWVNLGDSYAGGGGFAPDAPVNQRRAEGDPEAWGKFNPASREAMASRSGTGRAAVRAGLKPKDLVGIPWRVAFALQADGWYLRSDIVWAKPNPMPESVTDRPTKAHEYVFLLTKRPRYFFDQEAVREANTQGSIDRLGKNGTLAPPTKHVGLKAWSGAAYRESMDKVDVSAGRNVRSVWQIATQPYPEAHFATFPEELARRCIVAGCPTRVCRVCGKPSERIVEHGEVTSTGGSKTGARASNMDSVSPLGQDPERSAYNTGEFVAREKLTVGWSDCVHNWRADWRPGVVLDPFIGSGTVAKVARDHQRHAIGIDLNRTYLELAARRLQQLSLLT